MTTRWYRPFVAAFAVIALTGCEREAPDHTIRCGDSCEAGATTCDASGLEVRCEIGEDGCLSWSEPQACSPAQVCSDGACRCTNPCQVGASVCDEDGNEVRCEGPDEDGCIHWAAPQPCASGQTCEGGACECDNRCDLGDTTCDLDGKLLRCAGPDAHGCNYWDPPEDCGEHQRCTEGACECDTHCDSGETVCDPDGRLQHCAGPDADGCNYWEPPEDCGDHEICAEGDCACLNPCSESGAAECTPELDAVLTCEGPDADGCFFFGSEATCDEGDVCVDLIAECRLDPPPECDGVNQCDYAGQKFCQNQTQYRECHYSAGNCLILDCT